MREVAIHDTLSGSVRRLEPREPPRVGIYACGPTVYDRIHVGNARPYVVFSLLKRFLTRLGYDVRLVINITDINDKIYEAARRAGVASTELATEMTRHYIADTDRLGLGRPDAEPRASETINHIVALIDELVRQGHAYVVDGDVYFRVRSFADYGKLSNRSLEEMEQGEGDDAARRKEAPQDFALWKARKPDEDTWWPSPWGEGRPGWHIECSAMAEALLGLEFEIHGGGSDLIFPHHENEIAQTEAARHRPLARIWMHNGMVELGDEKMAKSVGNIRRLHEVLDRFGREALLMYFVGGHYRQPLRFSEELLAEAQRAAERVRELGRRLDPDGPELPGADALVERFDAALAHDFNTPKARAVVFEWVGELNRRLDAGERLGPGRLRDLLWVFGLDSLLAGDTAVTADGEAQALLEERERARRERDFARADALRARLRELGWEVRDTPTGPQLVRR
ncbi:cysteine--tRNA ligase [Thermoleophilum album]|uniref:cysteine--tRNA ligase n=1 Tax=Thermoleophilum album TaxID=29539 RepID=UPI00237CF456|nr:cysteine--tRNA ligase [Thermoleophilum album]WDT93271.1 cysteine--tRNA ligase [Thermoleophilum album]